MAARGLQETEKRKKFYRPPQKLFDMEAVREIGGEATTDGDFLIFENNRYSRKGFLFKSFAMSAIVSADLYLYSCYFSKMGTGGLFCASCRLLKASNLPWLNWRSLRILQKAWILSVSLLHCSFVPFRFIICFLVKS